MNEKIAKEFGLRAGVTDSLNTGSAETDSRGQRRSEAKMFSHRQSRRG